MSRKHHVDTIEGCRICTECGRLNPRGSCGGRKDTDEQLAVRIGTAVIMGRQQAAAQAGRFVSGSPKQTQTTLLAPTDAVPARLKCKSTDYYTPDYVVDAIHEALGGVALDPCGREQNDVRAAWVYTQKDDGLSKPWVDRTYCNPPYGEGIHPWLSKAKAESELGHRILLMLPAGTRFATEYFQRDVLHPRLTAQAIFDHRLPFSGQPFNMYDSIVWAYNVPAVDVARAFGSLATVLQCSVAAKPGGVR